VGPSLDVQVPDGLMVHFTSAGNHLEPPSKYRYTGPGTVPFADAASGAAEFGNRAGLEYKFGY
jgi:hypothetical protein